MSESSDPDAPKSGSEGRAEQRRPRAGNDGAGTGRPDRGGSGPIDVLQEPVPKQYLVGIVGTLTALALGIFLLVLLLGSLGGPTVTSDELDDLGQEEQDLVDDAYALTLVSTAIGVGPYAGLAVVTGFGLLVGTTLERRRNDKLLVSAAGAGAGMALFLVLLVVLASSQLPSEQVLAEASGAASGGVVGTEVDYGQLFVNAVVLGVAGGAIAAGAAYFGDRLELDGASA